MAFYESSVAVIAQGVMQVIPGGEDLACDSETFLHQKHLRLRDVARLRNPA